MNFKDQALLVPSRESHRHCLTFRIHGGLVFGCIRQSLSRADLIFFQTRCAKAVSICNVINYPILRTRLLLGENRERGGGS